MSKRKSYWKQVRKVLVEQYRIDFFSAKVAINKYKNTLKQNNTIDTVYVLSAELVAENLRDWLGKDYVDSITVPRWRYEALG